MCVSVRVHVPDREPACALWGLRCLGAVFPRDPAEPHLPNRTLLMDFCPFL